MSVVVLVAPAAFKGSFGPRQVADALSAGIRRALPEASLLQCPISDGGDGLLDAVLAARARRAGWDGRSGTRGGKRCQRAGAHSRSWRTWAAVGASRHRCSR